MFLAVAALGSMLLAMTLAILYDHLTPGFRSAREIKNELGLKMLGAVPKVRLGGQSIADQVLLKPLEPFAEAIRTMNPKGVILSGSHASVYEESTDKAPPAVFELGVPVLADKADPVGEVSTAFKLLGPNHKILVEAFDDPKIAGVACYLARPKTGGVKGGLGLAGGIKKPGAKKAAPAAAAPAAPAEAETSAAPAEATASSAEVSAEPEAPAAPKPPTAASSTVTATSCVVSSLRMSASSSGLAKRASATVVEKPRAPSSSAARRDSPRRAPKETRPAVPETVAPVPVMPAILGYIRK